MSKDQTLTLLFRLHWWQFWRPSFKAMKRKWKRMDRAWRKVMGPPFDG